MFIGAEEYTIPDPAIIEEFPGYPVDVERGDIVVFPAYEYFTVETKDGSAVLASDGVDPVVLRENLGAKTLAIKQEPRERLACPFTRESLLGDCIKERTLCLPCKFDFGE